VSEQVRFEAVAFRDLPGWAEDRQEAALAAFVRSCGKGRLAGLDALCRMVPQPPVDTEAARRFFEAHFVPHRVVHQGPPGLLTSYYEPILDGARSPSARFSAPLYRRPPDLVTLIDDALRGAAGDRQTHARQTPSGLVPYPTRAEIDAGALEGRGLAFAYLVDPVEAFLLQVQGSGQIRLADGGTMRVAYDGKNGHPYTSIGRVLIDSGEIAEADMSLDALKAWLRADPARGRALMQRNASFVFFRPLAGSEADHVYGVDGIPLTAGRSLAVDAGVHAVGTPVYVVAPTAVHITGAAFQRLMVAQDVGSAIRGPERGDIFAGSGPEAGRIAGITKHPGQFFVLLPRR
jgi:membrane-bound lytic murein transglycosylase A